MKDWHTIHRKIPQKSKGTNEQTPPMTHTSICQMCHIQIQDFVDWILMELWLMMHLTTAFLHFSNDRYVTHQLDCDISRKSTFLTISI